MPPQWNSTHDSQNTQPDPLTVFNGRIAANGSRRTAPTFGPRAERRQAEAERATRLALMDCYNG